MIYFLLVFGTGFILGTVRTLWVAPVTGDRVAELLESPLMLVVTIIAARRTVRHFSSISTSFNRFSIGLIGLCLMLTAELGVMHWVRHLTVREYLASRDPIAGTVYVILLSAFAVMPLLVSKQCWPKHRPADNKAADSAGS